MASTLLRVRLTENLNLERVTSHGPQELDESWAGSLRTCCALRRFGWRLRALRSRQAFSALREEGMKRVIKQFPKIRKLLLAVFILTSGVLGFEIHQAAGASLQLSWADNSSDET